MVDPEDCAPNSLRFVASSRGDGKRKRCSVMPLSALFPDADVLASDALYGRIGVARRPQCPRHQCETRDAGVLPSGTSSKLFDLGTGIKDRNRSLTPIFRLVEMPGQKMRQCRPA